jgi:hypothetical protein
MYKRNGLRFFGLGLEMEGIKREDEDECVHMQRGVQVVIKCRKICLCVLERQHLHLALLTT